MIKKILLVFLILIFVCISGLQAFADGDADIPAAPVPGLIDIIGGKSVPQTGQFLVKVTKPSGNETTDTNPYVICGITELKDIRFVIAVYDEEKGAYIPSNGELDGLGDYIAGQKDGSLFMLRSGETEGKTYESSLPPGELLTDAWFENNSNRIFTRKINSFGLFTQSVDLVDGANKIKVVAYTRDALENPLPGKNIQVNCFTVTYLSQSLKDRIINSFLKITEFFKGLFN